MVKVSVIIPVYNAEKYLAECLDSVINQTFNDLEIICINDGSTDGSLEILESYAKSDKRFTIISQENQGQGVARNKGLDMLKGDYFCFLDSDDKLELKTIEECYNLSEENSLDMVMFKLINYDDDTKEFYTTPGYDMYDVYSKVKDNVFNFNDLGESIFNVTVSPANKLFNSKFVLDSGVKFPKGKIFEDNIFFWRLFFNAQRIMFCNEYFYIRRRHSTSTTGFGGKRWVDSIDVYTGVWDIFKEFGYFDKFKKRLYNNKINFAFYRYGLINEDSKDYFFNAWHDDLIRIKNSHFDFEDLLGKKERDLFYMVLYSKNSEEFDLANNIYELSNHVKELNYKNKCINDNLISALHSEGNFSDINKNLMERNAQLNNQLEKLKLDYSRLLQDYNYSKKINKELMHFQDEVYSSNSWKLTSVLRKFRMFFK